MPDEQLLARWLEDELDGAEMAQLERWMAGRDDWAAWREETRAWKRLMQQALPAEAPPPAEEFFAARIARVVRDGGAVAARVPPSAAVGRRFGWGGWWMPAAAAAGMVLCFWAGTRLGGAGPVDGVIARNGMVDAGRPKLPAASAVYTPEQGVKARVFDEVEVPAVVIVLDGVAAIPDSFEVPDRATSGGDGAGGRAEAEWLSQAGEP